MVGIHHKFDGIGAKIANFLGEISYPVYAIHTPIIWVMGFVVKKVTGITDPHQLVWFGLIILPITVALSYLALKLYDEPLRQYLKRNLK
jgi:peptidoglycan/LPS O-acetylase OafA/YrhL